MIVLARFALQEALRRTLPGAEDPDEVTKAGENVDRSQGAAKAITV